MIEIERVDIGEAPTDVIIVLSIPPDMTAEFKVAMTRAMNTWQDPSPQMRDFYDRLMEREHVMGDNMKRALHSHAEVMLNSMKPEEG